LASLKNGGKNEKTGKLKINSIKISFIRFPDFFANTLFGYKKSAAGVF